MAVPTRKLLFKPGNRPKAQDHPEMIIIMNLVMKLLEQVQNIIAEHRKIRTKESLIKLFQLRTKSAAISELQLIMEKRS